MGRGGRKLNMELIAAEKNRRMTFQKRKKGIMKKAYELETLCGVDMCLIIYGPKQSDRGPAEIHTWPPEPAEVNRIIEKSKNITPKKALNLKDLMHDRNKKIDDDNIKDRKRMYAIKYSAWDERLNSFSESQLEELINGIDQKIELDKITVATLSNAKQAVQEKLMLGGSNPVGEVTTQLMFPSHNFEPCLDEQFDGDQKPNYQSLTDMQHMPCSFNQPSYPQGYPQMPHFDLDWSPMIPNPRMGYLSSFYNPSGANDQMIMQTTAENMMAFNNNVASSCSSMSNYSQPMQKPMPYTQYPMNIWSISSHLGAYLGKDQQDDY